MWHKDEKIRYFKHGLRLKCFVTCNRCALNIKECCVVQLAQIWDKGIDFPKIGCKQDDKPKIQQNSVRSLSQLITRETIEAA